MGGGGAIAPKDICKLDPVHMYSLEGCQAEEAAAAGGISSQGNAKTQEAKGNLAVLLEPCLFCLIQGAKADYRSESRVKVWGMYRIGPKRSFGFFHIVIQKSKRISWPT